MKIQTPHNFRKPLPIDKRSSWKGFSTLIYTYQQLITKIGLFITAHMLLKVSFVIFILK